MIAQSEIENIEVETYRSNTTQTINIPLSLDNHQLINGTFEIVYGGLNQIKESFNQVLEENYILKNDKKELSHKMNNLLEEVNNLKSENKDLSIQIEELILENKLVKEKTNECKLHKRIQELEAKIKEHKKWIFF